MSGTETIMLNKVSQDKDFNGHLFSFIYSKFYFKINLFCPNSQVGHNLLIISMSYVH
jgi:hypothetical protein